MKDMFCQTVKIKMFCGHAGAAGATSSTQATCTGTSCCQQSSCYSNIVPMMKCSRAGASKCVGGGLPATKGMCQCKFGPCTNGKCPEQSSTLGTSTLFDDTTPVAADLAVGEEEQEAIGEHIPLAILSAGLLVTSAVLGL